MGCDSSAEHRCCPPGSWPALNVNYTPLGQNDNAEGLKIYHVGQGKKALIILQDIFGIQSGRHKSVADTFAVMGFNVFVPEFLDPPYSGVEDVPKIMEVIKSQKLADLKARYQKVARYLQGKGFEKWFAAGYCWGAWFAVKMAAQYGNIIAVAAIHPSFQIEFVHGSSDVALIKGSKCPIYINVAGNDAENIKPNGELAKHLIETFGDKSGVQEFANQKHGWVMRGDLAIEEVRKDVEKSLNLTKDYFGKFA